MGNSSQKAGRVPLLSADEDPAARTTPSPLAREEKRYKQRASDRRITFDYDEVVRSLTIL